MNLFTKKVLLLATLLFIGVGTLEAKKKNERKAEIPRETVSSSSQISKLIDYGKELLGRRYRSRGPGGVTLDCSGFVGYVFSKLDIKLPRTSRDMAGFTQSVSKQDVRPGDLLYFRGRGGRGVGHVAMVVDVQGSDIMMMHSSSSRGIIIEKYNSSAYFTKRYVGAGRVTALSKLIEKDGAEEAQVAQVSEAH